MHRPHIIQQPRAILLGLTLQLLWLPLLAAALVMLFQLPAELACGLLILSVAPGGATSNMIALLARANTALSISLTALASLITPLPCRY